MFDSLLIANRGEIALRILSTAARLGVRTVAVYSSADANAEHVRQADQAVWIGPAEASASYLSVDAVLAAAKASGVAALHPGYGFLSERASFAAACAEQGLVFVGPSAAAIDSIGDKAKAKALLSQHGVPMLPSYYGAEQGSAYLLEQAQRIGFPVLIKATAGGGGKGMKLVERAEDFLPQLASAQREAEHSFGLATVLLEKFLPRARHIEVQLLADQHGQVAVLGERDCSLQRRHQKVLEEAPAVLLSQQQRQDLAAAATAAAQAIAYTNAGTVEFLAELLPDGSLGGFYFMEMNTRLQVEHPVTEAIFGLDLVEWQLRIASGEALPAELLQRRSRGVAVEVRLYAENPAQGFLPAMGRIQHYQEPQQISHFQWQQGQSWRVDAALSSGQEVSAHYDPMLAKLMAYAPTRDQALLQLRQLLAEVHLSGIANNLLFLETLLSDPVVLANRHDIGYIERESHNLVEASSLERPLLLAAVAAECAQRQRGASASAWGRLDGFRLSPTAWIEHWLWFNPRQHEAHVRVQLDEQGCQVACDDEPMRPLSWQQQGDHWLINHGGEHIQALVYPLETGWFRVESGGQWALWQRHDRLKIKPEQDSLAAHLRSPMPARVVALEVAVGDTVRQGQKLLVLEAMKMEHTISAPYAGTVTELLCQLGGQVKEGQELIDVLGSAE